MNGSAGGLTLSWIDEVKIDCIWKSNRILSFDVNNEGAKWRLFGCHGTPYSNDKNNF